MSQLNEGGASEDNLSAPRNPEDGAIIPSDINPLQLLLEVSAKRTLG